MNLTIRQRQPELMDQPGLEACAHRKALAGIKRVNGISRIGCVLWREIAHVARDHHLEEVRILDLACGGGDLAIWLTRRGRGGSFDVSVDGCDMSRTAVAYAREQAHVTGTRNARFFECDVLNGSFDRTSNESYDIVMCSLFLHHLEEKQVTALLRKMALLARHAVMIDDLRRTRLGYQLAWIGCRLLTRSPMVHTDGPLSVQGAFTMDEARSLAEEAGLQDVSIVTHWPQRFLMTWQRDKDA